jgi:putative aldouronate transport system substrate-binding protein
MRTSRRRFIELVSLGCSTGLFVACAPASTVAPPPTVAPPTALPPTPAAKPTAPPAPAATSTTVPVVSAPVTTAAPTPKPPVLPTYIPLANKPKADYPSKGVLYEDGYIKYPANPIRSIQGDPPGLGGTTTILVDGLYPPATPLDQNPAWQEINKRLNANVQFQIASAAEYGAKLATVIAGGDLPDMLSLFGGLNATPNLPAFLQQAAADLTPYLGGDAVKDYPNLAAIPTFAWRNVGSVIGGKLYQVPTSRPIVSNLMLRNSTVWDQEIGANYVPKNAEDFKRVMQQLTQPSANRWAIGSFQGKNTGSFEMAMFASIFGAPNNWLLEPGGKLVKDFETPQYKEAVGYLRDVIAAGLFFPDSLTTPSPPAGMTNLVSGKCVLAVRTLGLDWADGYQQGQRRSPPVTFGFVPAFAAHDGAKASFFLGTGYASGTMLKKASPERIKELLRILNWTAAPFGSEEDLLLTYGVEGVDYALDSNGNPVTTEKWTTDAYNMPWRYLSQRPQVMYNATYPEFTKLEADAEQTLIPAGISDPTLGYVSPTNQAKGAPVNLAFFDGLTDVLVGRRPLADFDQLVKDWATNAGDQIRKEYTEAMS